MKTNRVSASDLKNPPRFPSSFAVSSRKFHKALGFLKKNCFGLIGLNDLCRASKLSRRGLHYAFEQYLGQTPGRELRRLRVERAKHLLINSPYKLELIARMSGYRNQNSFWVSFREVVGKSPGQFRKHFRRHPVLHKNSSRRTLGAKGLSGKIALSGTVGRSGKSSRRSRKTLLTYSRLTKKSQKNSRIR